MVCRTGEKLHRQLLTLYQPELVLKFLLASAFKFYLFSVTILLPNIISGYYAHINQLRTNLHCLNLLKSQH